MTTDKEQGGGSQVSRTIFVILAWLLVACIATQTLFAGMAVFNDPARWKLHENFVHLFEFLPLVMFVFAVAGRLPKGLSGWTLLMLLLVFLQYMTAHVPAVGAIHPVMALVLIVLSLHVARRGQRLLGRS